MITNCKALGTSTAREYETSGVTRLGIFELLSKAIQVPSMAACEGNCFVGVQGIEANGAVDGGIDEGFHFLGYLLGWRQYRSVIPKLKMYDMMEGIALE